MIKRYANRKLYDPQASQYVTLEDLEEIIRAGREITVTDATTGEDLTAVILARIILENARHRRPTLPAAFLHQLVQYGETWHDFALASLKTSLEGLKTSQREADRIVREWASRCGWMPRPQRGRLCGRLCGRVAGAHGAEARSRRTTPATAGACSPAAKDPAP